MGLQSTQILGPILDGAMRNNKEGLEFVREAKQQGIKHVVKNVMYPGGTTVKPADISNHASDQS